ncbi:hemagglutinin repeat-containing protein [Bisgaard Taxon 10/6]|uniref:two-partner secretion domain-containing protein n=1 Tax=Exercitatus varius TaxID=67857 RepID=UPI00294ABC27|nr:hemagglutinin repeat-containing protein [Exercitatus varius]MDG2915359.1 hemagglutinin repeat-containing protein [Exercitatus varius]
MNKYCYRVIFSRKKQRFVVTSELSKSAAASSGSKKTNENSTALFVFRGWQNGLNTGLSAVNFALFLALGFVFMSEAQAEDLAIRADKSAPGNQQATVLQTANGLPQVNIQTPSAGGVSRNVYSQLDVAEKGAVFNNARKAVQTQLAGWVQGNPNLATGEAKVILNEVNSNQPSHLKGYMEVAGRKADVIIANPSGIHCDGCGVINAGRAGFTTGKPELEDGNLKGFNVQTGKVTVSGKGMDTSRVDYTDIIAKEVEVKGGVWAQELKITTGQNWVSSSHDDVVYVGDKNAEKNSEKIDRTFNPRYAVDVSELGGMYAGKIRLVDNDNGLGVRNAGHIGATAGEVKIDSRGQIVNRGTINSPHDVSLSAQRDIDNSGNIESKRGNVQLGSGQSIRQSGSVSARQGDTDIRIKGKLNQSGETVSGGKIRIQAQSVQAERSALLAAGVEVTESAQGVTRTLSLQGNNSKDLVIDAEGQIVLNGKNVATGNMSVAGAQIDLNHSQTAANNIDASTRQGDIQANRANLTARENLTFATPKTLSAQYSQVTAKQFVTRQQIFDVEQGVWQQTGNGDFNLRAQQIKNNQGALITQGALLTDADTIENRQGMIYSPRFLATAQKLDNENGEIYADDIHLTNQYFDNRKGRIYARTFNAVSQNLDNREGVLAATDLGLTSSTIQNQAISGTGSLINGANLTIHVDTLNNQNTKATQSVPTQGILAGNLTIRANQLNNQQGGLYAEDSLKTTVENALGNTQGEILSANLVEIASRQARLTVDNSEGKIEAGNRLTLNAKTLAHEGSINTGGDAEIALKDDFTLNRAFGVNGNLTFSTEGNLKNNTVLRVGNKASIFADAIENVATGEISATDTEITAQSLLNRGLIDGDNTVLNVTELENKGTGRIYGNHLAIQSQHLRNLNETVSGKTSAGTIAARERLDLGVGTLTNYNHSLILSLNKLYIGGKLDANHEATGSAAFVDNGSADIEALGDGVIDTTRLWNHDLHLVLGKKYDYEFIQQYHLLNSTTVYRTGVDGTMNWNNDNRHDKNAYFDFYDKSKSSIGSPDWIQEEFTRETITPTIEHQEPARISIGGNLDLRGDDLTNEASRFEIGRRLTLGNTDFVSNRLNSDLTGADGVQLKNIDIEDDIIRIDRGIAKTIGAERHRCGRHHCWGHYDHGSVVLDRVLPPLKYSFRFVSNPIGQGITNSGTDIAQKAYANQVSLTQLKVNSVSGTPTTIKTSRTDLSLPTASLYRINPKAGQYLVETDSRFTDRRQWLSSDYMLNTLRTQNLLKRLGDGYYEQRLVNEQINQLTGRRFLEGYSSDYDQYKALMDSGIQYAQRFNLIPGVALTEEQMQNLTSDMVWLVKKRVTLADGTQTEVLAPQVYIVARNTDVDSQGAVISANDIIINTQGNIQNGGIIAGRNLTGLAANNIENLGGRLQGRDLYLFAKNRLLNAGGELSAGNSLLAQADNIEIESRVTESEKVTANSNKAGFSRREIDRVATVNVGEDSGGNGHAELFARENLSIKGANISVTGNAAFTALNRLSLGGVSTQNQEHIVPNADNYYKLDQSREVGSQINVTGDSRLTGKSAVDLTGVFLHNEGALQIASEGDIRVQASRSLERIASGSTSKSKGELSHSRTIKKHEHDYDLAQGSQLDADRIEISSAQGNVTIAGSDVVAENDLAISGKNILIQEAENAVYEENYEQTKKSGLLGSGGIGLTIGQRKTTLETDQTKYYASGSQVGSLNGDVSLTADNQYRQQASQVTAVDGDVNIVGKQVDIVAADDRYETNYKQTYEQKGLTISVTAPVISAIQATDSALESMSQIGKSENRRINLMAGANTAWDAARAAESIGRAIAPTQALLNGDMKNSNVGISLTYGQQKNVDSTHTQGSTATVSKINAGKAVNIVAKGDENGSDIHISGADISGKQGTYLSADNDILISAAKQSHQERSKNKSEGFNAGVSVTYGQNGFAMGMTAGGNYGKGYGNGDEVTYAYSHVGDSASQTLLRSGQDTHIQGAQIQGKGIKVNAENLWIESLQETMTYEGKQQNMSGQVTAGYGFSASGSYNRSKTDADYASVVEQSGIYAGDEGYQIDVTHNTDLKGAVITSTDNAEAAGKNMLSTGTLSYADIQNYSNYDAEGFGLSGGFTVEGDFTIPLGGRSDNGSNTDNISSATVETDKDKRVVQTIENMGGREISKNVNKQDKNVVDNVQLNGVAGIFSQGNWGIAKALSSAVLGQVSDKGNQTGMTKSSINTKNIIIRDGDEQRKLTGLTTEETISEIDKENTHRTVNKVNIEDIKSKIERDLDISQDFVNNLNQIGDKLYYEVEKKQNNIVVKYKSEGCTDPSCLRTFELDMDRIKNKELTNEEAQILSRIYVHGIFNMTDEDRMEGGILYGGSDTLNNASILVRKAYAGVAEELTYAVFERIRAGLDLPMIFGASNASRDQATIWDKLNQYNQVNPADQVNLTHVAHSLGVSGTKNAMNWANSQGMNFNHLNANLTALGTSYPVNSDIETGYFDTATGLFGKTKLDYSIAPRDCIGTCLLIGRTASTAENTKIGIPLVDLLLHHGAYIKDEKVLEFYGRENEIEVLKYIWNKKNDHEFSPIYKTLESK